MCTPLTGVGTSNAVTGSYQILPQTQKLWTWTSSSSIATLTWTKDTRSRESITFTMPSPKNLIFVKCRTWSRPSMSSNGESWTRLWMCFSSLISELLEWSSLISQSSASQFSTVLFLTDHSRTTAQDLSLHTFPSLRLSRWRLSRTLWSPRSSTED